jgi:hypothetical protein
MTAVPRPTLPSPRPSIHDARLHRCLWLPGWTTSVTEVGASGSASGPVGQQHRSPHVVNDCSCRMFDLVVPDVLVTSSTSAGACTLSSCWQRAGQLLVKRGTLGPDALLQCCERCAAPRCETLPRRLLRPALHTTLHLCVAGLNADRPTLWLHFVLRCCMLIS